MSAPHGAGTIDIGAIADGPTNTTQNGGTPATSLAGAAGGLALLVSGGDLSRVALARTASNGPNGSETVKFWAPVSKTGLGTVNAPVTFAGGSPESDLASDSRAANATGEGRADPTTEVTPVPELWTWAMIALGFAGVGLFSLATRRKQPRYTI